MAALMPMRYCAVAGCASETTVRSATSSVSTVISILRLEIRHLGGDPLFLVFGVHRLDQLAVARGHEPALHFSRGGHRLALELGIELARQEPDRLHLLDARAIGVPAPPLALHQPL